MLDCRKFQQGYPQGRWIAGRTKIDHGIAGTLNCNSFQRLVQNGGRPTKPISVELSTIESTMGAYLFNPDNAESTAMIAGDVA